MRKLLLTVAALAVLACGHGRLCRRRGGQGRTKTEVKAETAPGRTGSRHGHERRRPEKPKVVAPFKSELEQAALRRLDMAAPQTPGHGRGLEALTRGLRDIAGSKPLLLSDDQIAR